MSTSDSDAGRTDIIKVLDGKIETLEKKFHSLKPLEARGNAQAISSWVILALLFVLFLLVLTPVGGMLGFNVYVLQPPTDKEQKLDHGVLAATRNMISVMGPIFLGLTIWLVTVVAERRLKTYDDSLEKQRNYIEGRTDKNREILDRQTESLRQEMDDFRTDVRSLVHSSVEQAKASIENSIVENVRSEIESERQKFDEAVMSEQIRLSESISEVGDLKSEIESRFGHIADHAGYARSETKFGEITSVGAVHSKVSSLFIEGKRDEAVILTREMLRLFEERNGSDRPSGSLNDWFNLSAVLGREKDEALALEICLAGLEQQNGAPVIDKKNNTSWQNDALQPHDDLLAHAIQYGSTVRVAIVPALLQLNGYDKDTNSAPPTWGWRSYMFTMQALATLGEYNGAIALGKHFIEQVRVSDDTSKVVQTLGNIIFKNGDHSGAIDLLEKWLIDNPNAAAAQIVATLLDWYDGVGDAEHVIALASRGIRDLAEEQPSTKTGNLFFRRALARDKRALLSGDDGSMSNSEICADIRLALRDYALAKKVDSTPQLHRHMTGRETILRDLASRLGCDLGGGGGGNGSGVDRIDLSGSGDSGGGGSGRSPTDRVRSAIQQVLPLLATADLDAGRVAEAIREQFRELDPMVRAAAIAMLSKVAADGDAPDTLRQNLAAVLPLLDD